MALLFPLVALALAPAPAAPVTRPGSDEEAIAAHVRGFADPTAGLKVKDGPADKVVFLGRAADGAVIAVGLAALPPGTALEEVPPETRAIIRTRASTPGGNRAPDAADAALAERTGMPVFVVGEWRKPPVIWEVMRREAGTQVRDIDAKGAAGAWRPLRP